MSNGLGDARLDARCAWLRDIAAKRPEASFPAMAGSEAGREAIYRFLNNPRVTLRRMLEPHYAQTVDRLAHEPVALMIHDSSDQTFSGENRRPGLGRLAAGQGFLAHVALAVSADGNRTPLGVLGVTTLFRDDEKRIHNETRRHAADRESLRWRDLVLETEQRAKHPALVHVMDREADSYELLHLLQTRKLRFVMRLNRNRLARGIDDEDWIRTSEQMLQAEAVFEREVQLSRRSADRPPGPRRSHPPRQGRTARLSIGAQQIVLRHPRKAPAGLPPTLTVNVVRVWEPDPPADQEPVEWVLLTSEKIDSAADLARIVDWYRARWIIEEFFKALKTGCAYEDRQLENRASLLNALALFVPIAWQMIALRAEARRTDRVVSRVITPTQLAVLRHLLPRKPLARPSAKELYAAIAEIGGHVSSNGEPGWLVLTRGFTKLRDYETIWDVAAAAKKM